MDIIGRHDLDPEILAKAEDGLVSYFLKFGDVALIISLLSSNRKRNRREERK